ncbi:MAG: SDR family NAD(P)-dependent oxidoreductase, partial [Ignavibacteriota bacterium]
MLDPIVDDFVNEVKDVILNSPQIPYTSNLTGSWISEKEVKDPSYWGKHANHTARFSDALEKAWLLNNCILLEVGPSNTLSVLAMQHPQRMKSENPTTIASLRADYDSQSDLNFILNSIGKLWLNGVNVNCEKLYENYKPKRIPLPTYPFEREYYWVDDLYSRRENISYQQKLPQEKRKEFKDWFYKPSWKKSVKTAETNLNTDYVTNTNWLIFSSGSELEKKLIEKLNKLSCVKVIVKNGSGFSYNSIDTIELNPQSETEYNKLFYDLSKQGFHPDIILHFWNYDAPNKLLSSEEELKSSLYRGIYSLLFIVKSLQASGNNQKTRIGIITKNLHAVLGNENLASPDTSMILGPSRVVNKEIENVLCKCIDFSSHENNTEEQIALLLNKSIWMDGHEIIAFRENYSWSQSLEQINITEHKNYDEIKLDKIKPGGVYLITGGTGGLGLTFAEYFAQSEKIKLILIKKSDFPLREKWTKENGPKDKTTEIINQISQIEKQGSIVEVHVCDISNESELKALINQVNKKYWKIDGIIHAAGIIDDALLLTKTPESIKRVLSAKVYGTRNLANTLNLIDLDFFILFSSINSYIAPVGQIDYSAANNYLDAFANLYKSLGANIVSINWPGWREKGILAELKVRDGLKKWKEKTLDEAISSEDGLKAFILALKSGLSQVVINPIPLFPINNEIYNSKSIEFNSPDPKSRLMKKPQTES